MQSYSYLFIFENVCSHILRCWSSLRHWGSVTVILGYINETDLKIDLILAWKSIVCYLDYLLSAGWSMGSCPKRLNLCQSISDGSGDYQQYTFYEIMKSLFPQITANTVVAYFSWTINVIIRRSSDHQKLSWYLHVHVASLHVSSEHRMGKWTHLFQDKAKRLRELLSLFQLASCHIQTGRTSLLGRLSLAQWGRKHWVNPPFEVVTFLFFSSNYPKLLRQLYE